MPRTPGVSVSGFQHLKQSHRHATKGPRMIEYYDGPIVSATANAFTVTPNVTTRATATPIAPAAHLIKNDAQWTHADLRDYILRQLERYNPSALARRNPAMEVAVCRSFCERWGADAPRIAKFAFETCRGMWNNAPITFARFSRDSDAYFAAVIAERLPQENA